MSEALRTRQNRMDNKVRGNTVVGGVRIDATEYPTGRTEVITKGLVPRNARQAAFVFGGE
jgi:hypothetical protein